MSRLTTVNSNYFEASNLNGTVVKRNIRNCMTGNFHCSTNRISRGLPRGYSFKSHWERNNGKTELNVTVPPNCTATIYFPDEKGKTVHEKTGLAKKIGKKHGCLLFEVSAGNYQFTN